jgi:outer membrane lipoprotein-sorting protein
MNLLLAVALLLQDKTAEETFKKLEETIEKAKTVTIKFKWERKPTKKQPTPSAASGSIFWKEGNKASVSVKFYEGQDPQLRQEWSLVSDGTQMKASGVLEMAAKSATPKDLVSGLAKILVRGGIYHFDSIMLLACSGNKGKEKLSMEDCVGAVQVMRLKAGEDDKAAKTLGYSLVSIDPDHEIRLWYDPASYRLLRRTYATNPFALDPEFRLTETYEEFSLNADIPDEKFKLPEEKK